MKRYFVKYGDFANVYDVVYVETDTQQEKAVADGFERITRAEAERLCRAELERRKDDEAFSGYASAEILPFDYPWDMDWRNDRRMEKHGFIIERKHK